MTTQRQENETLQTRYGLVDRTTLERLRDRFVTADLLHAVDTVDASDDISETRRMRLRTQLLRLHGMAMALINGFGAGVTPGEPIWELADEIAEDLEGGAADFSGIVTMLHQLTALEPHDADDDDLLPVS